MNYLGIGCAHLDEPGHVPGVLDGEVPELLEAEAGGVRDGRHPGDLGRKIFFYYFSCGSKKYRQKGHHTEKESIFRMWLMSLYPFPALLSPIAAVAAILRTKLKSVSAEVHSFTTWRKMIFPSYFNMFINNLSLHSLQVYFCHNLVFSIATRCCC